MDTNIQPIHSNQKFKGIYIIYLIAITKPYLNQ